MTSTLLLVHADEEEAFWVLSAIIERILPEDFFSPSLLSSRACPLVLQDYVQELLPKLHSHMTQLGIDLPAICFSWFLSLFTDCLPIEVSPCCVSFLGSCSIRIFRSRPCSVFGTCSLWMGLTSYSASHLPFCVTTSRSCFSVNPYRLSMSP